MQEEGSWGKKGKEGEKAHLGGDKELKGPPSTKDEGNPRGRAHEEGMLEAECKGKWNKKGPTKQWAQPEEKRDKEPRSILWAAKGNKTLCD